MECLALSTQLSVRLCHGSPRWTCVSFRSPSVPRAMLRVYFTPAANNAQFITVSLTGPLKRLSSPGNTDPAIPEVVSQKLEDAAGQSPRGSSQWQKFDTTSQVWKLTSQSMQRGSGIPWWSKTISSNPDEMTYECDATLGSPAEADCAQIEWNQLGPWSISPPSDMVSVGPGKVQFLHSSECSLYDSFIILSDTKEGPSFPSAQRQRYPFPTTCTNILLPLDRVYTPPPHPLHKLQKLIPPLFRLLRPRHIRNPNHHPNLGPNPRRCHRPHEHVYSNPAPNI